MNRHSNHVCVICFGSQCQMSMTGMWTMATCVDLIAVKSSSVAAGPVLGAAAAALLMVAALL